MVFPNKELNQIDNNLLLEFPEVKCLFANRQALDEDEAINLAQQEAYKSTITELKIRINVLESKQVCKFGC